MLESQTNSESSRMSRESPSRDSAITVGITAVNIIVSACFNLSERLYGITRHWEQYSR